MSKTADERIRELEAALAAREAESKQVLDAGRAWKARAEELEAKVASGAVASSTTGAFDEAALSKLIDAKLSEAVKPLLTKAEMATTLATESMRQVSGGRIDAAISEAEKKYANDLRDIPHLDDIVSSQVGKRIRAATAKGETVDPGQVTRQVYDDIVAERKRKRDEFTEINRKRAEEASRVTAVPDIISAAGITPSEWKKPKSMDDADKLMGRLLASGQAKVSLGAGLDD